MQDMPTQLFEITSNGCCGSCGAKLKQHTSKGAAYFKGKRHLQKKHIHILAWWQSSQFKEAWTTKATLFKEYNFDYRFTKEEINLNPFNARISELVGAGIIFKTDQIKDGYNNTIEGSFYKINYEKLDQVIKNEGLIK